MPRPRRITIITIAVVLTLWLLQGLGVVPALGWMTRLIAPVSSQIYASGISVARWWDVVRRGHAVLAEAHYWRHQAEVLAGQVGDIKELTRQRDELAALVNFRNETHYPLIGARLLGSAPAGRVGTRVIDRGSESKVVMGQPVVSSAGALVGVIREVWNGGATIMLLDSPQSRVAAMPLGKQSSGGMVGGVYDLGLLLTTIRPDEPLVVGDIIGTVGTQSGLPRGLPIGIVRQVWRAEGDLFTTAALEPLADIHSLTEVAVLLTTL
jgi:cell shape-determining protein MreC